ncbi:MAG TPA: membrane protein insertion efficiency factor YidD [Deltaproteobacteria bacterium]|nr:membrane protein insertion efficiency factor YidD [Deltaproteobacteria bacterium]
MGKKILITLIHLYQRIISPCFISSCRFYPTCSDYAIDAITRYGGVRGVFMTLLRLLKCHPFHPGGYDPV